METKIADLEREISRQTELVHESIALCDMETARDRQYMLDRLQRKLDRLLNK